jgi:predicted aldo/keto reductase-like oxidoreductase
MPNLTLLMSNTAAAADRTRLSATERELLTAHARETCSGYCAGCTRICEAALSQPAPIGDVMRYLMYSRSYGDSDRARAEFRALPESVRKRLTDLDYTVAERRCPQKMSIGRLMRAAAQELG